jgi:5'-3' exonuclease
MEAHMAMNDNELLLIDLSSLAHPIFHMSGAEPDPNHVSTQVVARVRALASDHPHAAVCCDDGKSFRAEVDPTYKAQRPEPIAPLQHQIKLAREILVRDGFPVWAVKGFEADDLIASATVQALAIEDTTVLIASADKDLLALVSDRVSAKSLTNGGVLGPAEVKEKFKVSPSQIADYLCLVGDASDNIKGAKGIGGVRASELLTRYGSLDGVYAAIDKGATPDITPAQRTALQEFRPRLGTVRQLVALRTDVEIPFAEIAAERVPVNAPEEQDAPEGWTDGKGYHEPVEPKPETAQSDLLTAAMPEAFKPFVQAPTVTDAPAVQPGLGSLAQHLADPETVSMRAAQPRTELVRAEPDWDRQLEPRSLDEAAKLAGRMFESRLFSAYGTWQGVFSTILAGRELGMPAMASLRAMHIIENKPTLSADTLAALVLRSGKAKYFRCSERSATRATFVTQRLPVEDYPAQSLTVTIEEMRAAWRKDQKAWDNSGWGKTPAAMLVARAKSALARLEYPDVVGNIYAFEEFD